MWTSIVSLASSIKEPWLLMGDFNAIRWGYEKSGGSAIDMGSAFDFNQCVDSSTLIEFPLDGPHFTWSNSSIDQRHIECKLDRALINMKFNQHAHRFEGSTRNSTLSYHKAIPVQSQDAVFLRPPFRYFNYWAKEELFFSVVRDTWYINISCSLLYSELLKKLASVKKALRLWKRSKGPLNIRINTAREDLEDIQSKVAKHSSPSLHIEEQSTRVNLKHTSGLILVENIWRTSNPR